MKNIVALVIFCVIFISVKAQPTLTFQQVFKNEPTGIFKNMASVSKWIDNNNFVITDRKENSKETKQWLVNTVTGSKEIYQDTGVKKISPTLELPANAKNATFSPNQQMVAYTLHNNLFVYELASSNIRQLTFDGNDSILNGYASWVYYEEILGRASRYKAFWWSNDSKKLVFMRFDETGVPVFPIYVPTGKHGYTEQTRYPKAGDKNPAVKIGLIDVVSFKTVWANFNEKDDQYFGTPLFTPTNELWIQWMNRQQNTLVTYRIDATTGTKTAVFTEQQNTWVDLDDNDRIEFLPSGKQFIVKSDKSGWYQFYLHDINGKELNVIGGGNYTVGSIIKIDEKSKEIFFTARKESSLQFDFYKASLDGKRMERLSNGNYYFSDIQLSPDAKKYTAVYSNVNTPTSVALFDVKGNLLLKLDSIVDKNFKAYTLPAKKVISVKSSDNLFDLPVQITYPINFDSTQKYPVLINIYGGPNAGRVFNRYTTNLTDAWWAQEGLIQVSIDNRSSGHFGKYGMNFIYKQMGIYEIEDYMTVGRWLKLQSWVDTSKLCITGGSFGGYMTCMALTYGASVFNYGIANASVTSWNLYDTHYTERYMSTPADNAKGYTKTSVLQYTKQYKGLLRIVHGTSDDNVHMQNSLQLINQLQDEQQHFEAMVYPGERHSIGGKKGVHNRLEAYAFYYRYLLNKTMPTDFWK